MTMHDLDRTLRSQESEYESFEYEGDFEAESYQDETEYGSGPLTEEQEIELASELLTISDEAELDLFFGKLLKRAGRALAPLGKFVKPLVKKALPIVGGIAGTYFGGPVGAKIGSKLGSFASNLFEVDMESFETDEMEMEVARRIVRLASTAAENAAQAPSNANPVSVARTALANAARVHAPGLIKRTGNGQNASRLPQSGRWIRRGRKIVVLLGA
jgi:uncharacterized protein (DUF697 family)